MFDDILFGDIMRHFEMLWYPGEPQYDDADCCARAFCTSTMESVPQRALNGVRGLIEDDLDSLECSKFHIAIVEEIERRV